MNIPFSPIKSNTLTQSVNYTKNGRISFCANNNKDTFIRTTPSKNNINNLNIEDLFSVIKDNNNEIGRGFNHIAYKLTSYPEYVLRIPSEFNIDSYKGGTVKIKNCEDPNLKINVGQKVSEIEITSADSKKSDKLEILKKQEGIPIGVTPYEVLIKNRDIKGENEYSTKEMKEAHEKSLEAIANLPVSSFEKLIETIQEASRNNYCFDYFNSNNLLFDKKTQSINIIDLEYGSNLISYGSVLFALTDGKYIKTYYNEGYPVSNEKKEQAQKYTETIMKKFAQAMDNKGLSEYQDNCMVGYFALFMGSMMNL